MYIIIPKDLGERKTKRKDHAWLLVTLTHISAEMLGFVIIKNMNNGVPVVGCMAGFIPGLVCVGGTSFLVPPTNMEGYL